MNDWVARIEASLRKNCAEFGMLAKHAYQLQKEGQNSLASGYDILTQLVGGFFLFDSSFWKNPSQLTRCEIDPAIFHEYFHVFYGGKGAETKIVTNSTWVWLEEQQRLSLLKHLSESLIDSMLLFFKAPSEFFHHCLENIVRHRRFFESYSNFPISISQKLSLVDGFDQSWTYKTTGAGGEDALILFGHKKDIMEAELVLKILGWKHYPGKAKTLCAEVIVEEN